MRLLLSTAVFGLITAVLLAVDGPRESLEAPTWVLAFVVAAPTGFVIGGYAASRLRRVEDYWTAVALGLCLLTVGLAAIKFSSPGRLQYVLMALACGLVTTVPWITAGRVPKRLSVLTTFVASGAFLALCLLFWPNAQFNTGIVLAAVGFAVCFTVIIAFANRLNGRVVGVLDLVIPALVLALAIQFPPISHAVSGIPHQEFLIQDLRHHHNFYLGPLNDVANGRVMLNGVWSQYGVGIFYALQAWFALVPLSYGGMALLIIVVSGIALLAVYIVLRLAGASAPLAATAMVIAGATSTYGVTSNWAAFYVGYPSLSPLRFGMPLVVVAAAVIGARRAPNSRSMKWEWLQVLTVSLSAVWSFETFVYCLASYGVIHLVGALAQGQGWLRRVGRDAVSVLAGSIAAILIFTVATLTLSGGVDWGPYVDFVLVYSADGYTAVPMAWFGPGPAAGAVIFASFVSLTWLSWCRPSAITAPSLIGIAGFTGAAMAEFTYYVGKSDMGTLRSVLVPVIASAALWVAVLLAGQTQAATLTLVAISGLLFVGGLVLVQTVPNLKQKWKYTMVSLVVPGGGGSIRNSITSYLREPVIDPQALDGAALLARNLPAGQPALVVVDPELTTEVLLRSRRRNALAMGAPWQDDAVAVLGRRAVDSAKRVRPGTLLLVGPPGCSVTGAQTDGCLSLSLGQRAVLEVLKRKFIWTLVDSTPGGLRLVRLEDRPVGKGTGG